MKANVSRYKKLTNRISKLREKITALEQEQAVITAIYEAKGEGAVELFMDQINE